MFSTFPVRVLLLAVLLSAIDVPSGFAADDLSGAWKMRLSFGDRGTRTSILKLERKDDALTGVMLSSQGGQSEIDNVRFENGELSFEMTRKWGDRKFTSQYSGKFVDGTIEGTAQFEFRGRKRTMDWVAARTTSNPRPQAAEPPPVVADIELTADNYEVWRDHIVPETNELAWNQIPWLTTFKDGILAANAADKPLLLWTMNGHPLGCT